MSNGRYLYKVQDVVGLQRPFIPLVGYQGALHLGTKQSKPSKKKSLTAPYVQEDPDLELARLSLCQGFFMFIFNLLTKSC